MTGLLLSGFRVCLAGIIPKRESAYRRVFFCPASNRASRIDAQSTPKSRCRQQKKTLEKHSLPGSPVQYLSTFPAPQPHGGLSTSKANHSCLRSVQTEAPLLPFTPGPPTIVPFSRTPGTSELCLTQPGFQLRVFGLSKNKSAHYPITPLTQPLLLATVSATVRRSTALHSEIASSPG